MWLLLRYCYIVYPVVVTYFAINVVLLIVAI